MNTQLKQKIIHICAQKILQKWENVWLSFYAFFENKNSDPESLMKVAEWWILENKFDHFEKAIKIQKIIQNL